MQQTKLYMLAPAWLLLWLRKRTPLLLSLFFLFFLSLSLLAPVRSYAQSYTPSSQSNNPYRNLNTNPDVPATQRTAVDSLMINIMASMICNLSGIDVMTAKPGQKLENMPQKCLGVDKTTGKIGFVQSGNGAIGMMGNLIAVLYEPPAHTADFTRYLASNFGLAHTANAQATGFQSLRNLLPVWVVFRNIVYFLFVIAFVIIGFLIMLRIKIDPRTVMSVQNSIPKLVVGILLITFSYAIAGFLIDLMWVTTYSTIGIMSQAVKATDQSGTFTESAATNNILDYPFRFFNRVFVGDFIGIGFLGTLEFSRNAADGVGILFRSLTDSGSLDFAVENSKEVGKGGYTITKYLAPDHVFLTASGLVDDSKIDAAPHCKWYQVWCKVGTSLTNIAGNFVEAFFSIIFGLFSWVVSLLAFFVILIAVTITLFRIWFTLLRAYVSILLGVVWAPFWILLGMFPGSSMNFTQWLRHMVAHLALFPATIVMFLMARVFIQAFEPSHWTGNDNSIFLPPLVGNANLPEAIGPILAFAVLMYTPHVLSMLRDALKTKSSAYSAAPGQGIAAGAGVLKGAAGAAALYKHGNMPSEGGVKALLPRLLG